MIVIWYTKLWFESSSLNSCIATKGYKYSPLPKVKKCNFWTSLFMPEKYVLIYLWMNLDIANSLSSQYLCVHVCCLKIQYVGKLQHILVNVFLWFLILIEFFKKVKHQCASNSLTFSSSNIISRNYFISGKSLIKKRERLGDIVLSIKELFFNKRKVNYNIPSYVKLETHP